MKSCKFKSYESIEVLRIERSNCAYSY